MLLSSTFYSKKKIFYTNKNEHGALTKIKQNKQAQFESLITIEQLFVHIAYIEEHEQGFSHTY